MSAKVFKIRDRKSVNDKRLRDLSDEALVAAAGAGDADAVGALFERFRDPVFRFLTRVVGGRPDIDVEDLVQQTFLVIVRGAKFDGRAKVSTWIFGIAANIARTHRRGRSRRFRFLEGFQSARTLTTVDADPDERLDVSRRLARVKAALEAEPLPRRMAFVLCEMEGMSAKEAGAVLKVSEAAIWKRVSETRRRLREAGGSEDV